MQGEAFALRCPFHNLQTLVGTVVVNDHKEVLVRVFAIKVSQKTVELHMGKRINTSSFYVPLIDDQGRAVTSKRSSGVTI